MENSMIKYITVDEESRLFFVTDIHGEVGTFLSGLESLGFEVGKDICVCAGDLIDRGRSSLDTASLFLNNTSGSFHSVLGNHDVFAFENNDNETGGLWLMNGGSWAFDDMNQHLRNLFGEEMKKLPYAIEVNYGYLKVGVTHASVPEDFSTWQDFIEMLTPDNKGLKFNVVWDRNFVEYSHCDDYQTPLYGVDFTIHGHTPVREPLKVGNRWHIDTGLVYGKHLTIAEVVGQSLKFHKFKLKEGL